MIDQQDGGISSYLRSSSHNFHSCNQAAVPAVVLPVGHHFVKWKGCGVESTFAFRQFLIASMLWHVQASSFFFMGLLKRAIFQNSALLGLREKGKKRILLCSDLAASQPLQ